MFLVKWNCTGRSYCYLVETLEEAVVKWIEWRDQAIPDGVGPRDCSGAVISGAVAVYRIAWDGTVWSGRERVPLRRSENE